MDVLRQCYTVPMRLFRDSERVVMVRWYFTDPHAPFLPFPTAFGSRIWNSECENAGPLGEQVPMGVWAKSWNRRGYRGLCYTGTPDQFLSGISEAENATAFECDQCATFDPSVGAVAGVQGRQLHPPNQRGGIGSAGGVSGRSLATVGQIGRVAAITEVIGDSRAISGQAGRIGSVAGVSAETVAVVTQVGGPGASAGPFGVQVLGRLTQPGQISASAGVRGADGFGFRMVGSVGGRWWSDGRNRTSSPQLGFVAGSVGVTAAGIVPVVTAVGVSTGSAGVQIARLTQTGSVGVRDAGGGFQARGFAQVGNVGCRAAPVGLQDETLAQVGSVGLRSAGLGTGHPGTVQVGSVGSSADMLGVERPESVQVGSVGVRTALAGVQAKGFGQKGSAAVSAGSLGVQLVVDVISVEYSNYVLTVEYGDGRFDVGLPVDLGS